MGNAIECEWYCSLLCDGCCDPENCANYIPKQVKEELEVKKYKQLTLFEL